mgnify:FL=1
MTATNTASFWTDAFVNEVLNVVYMEEPRGHSVDLVVGARGLLGANGLLPHDPAAVRLLRRLRYEVEAHTLSDIARDATRARCGVTETEVAARAGTSRRARAPLRAQDCVMPWLYRTSGLLGQMNKMIAFAKAHPKTILDGSAQSYMLCDFIDAWSATQQVFRVSETFADMLAQTETPSVLPRDFALPYDAFWIAIPGCARQMCDDIAGGSLALAGIGVRLVPAGVILPVGGRID